MSRLGRYKESLNKFIKDRSCLFGDNIPDGIESILYEEIKNCDLLLPILLLTIMNNQNKKNRISMQGYFAAAGIVFITAMLNITEKKNIFIEKYGINKYQIIINYLILSSNL